MALDIDKFNNGEQDLDSLQEGVTGVSSVDDVTIIDEYTDRFGHTRKTLPSIIDYAYHIASSSGWSVRGDWAIGEIAEKPTDIFKYQSAWYHSTATTLPHQIDGASPDLDSGDWIAVFDDSQTHQVAVANNVSFDQVAILAITVAPVSDIRYFWSVNNNSTYRAPSPVSGTITAIGDIGETVDITANGITVTLLRVKNMSISWQQGDVSESGVAYRYGNADYYDPIGGNVLGASPDKHFLPFSYSPDSNSGLSNIQQRLVAGEQLIFKFFGDSLTYGFDPAGTAPPINGSSDPRASITYTEALADSISTLFTKPAVFNRGFPGDTSENWKTRWPNYENGDVSVIMYGTNDALDSGDGTPKVPVSEYKANIEQLILRELFGGTRCIVLMQSPDLKNANDNNPVIQFRSRRIPEYRAALSELGEKYQIPVVSASELVGHMGAYAYSDNTHYNEFGYNEIGWNLAAIFFPNGMDNTYSVGDTVTPLNSKAVGWLTGVSGSRYILNGDGVAFSLLSGSRDLFVFGWFSEDCYVAFNSIVSSASATTVLASKSGGDRSGQFSYTTTLSNDGTSRSKRKSSALFVNKGYRVIWFRGATVGAIEKIEILKSAIDDSTNTVVKGSTGQSLLPLSTDLQTLTTDTVIEQGMTVVTHCDLPDSGGGVVIYGRPDFNGVPTSYIFAIRLNQTSLYVRKFVNGTPTDQTVTGVFQASTSRYTFSFYWDKSTDSLLIDVNNENKVTVSGAAECLTDESRLGVISVNNANPVEMKTSASDI